LTFSEVITKVCFIYLFIYLFKIIVKLTELILT